MDWSGLWTHWARVASSLAEKLPLLMFSNEKDVWQLSRNLFLLRQVFNLNIIFFNKRVQHSP